jgi:hypothetical protein
MNSQILEEWVELGTVPKILPNCMKVVADFETLEDGLS